MPHPALDKRFRQPPPVAPGAMWVTMAQLRVRYGGMSQAWLENKIKLEPDFPRPHYFGASNLRFFRLSEVEDFERRHLVEAAP
jgi:predicted DNA-binding transcriptional regulator AlpA